MTEKFYPREHDLLKISNIDHYCPDKLKEIDEQGYEMLKQKDIFKSFKHHCNFHYGRKERYPKCSDPYKDGLRRELILISLADWKASAISRKLRTAKHSDYEVFKIWKDKKDKEKGKKIILEEIIKCLKEGKEPAEIFNNNLCVFKKRPEDINRPFASLFVHSDLTERWFQFFNNNNDYFGLPDKILSVRESWENIYNISGRVNPKKGKIRKPIFFVRLKLNVNQKLARISDTKIINEIENLIKRIPQTIQGSQELYNLYDEILLVMRPQNIDDKEKEVKESLERQLQSIETFTTNYYLEGNISKTYLSNKEFLQNFDKIFGEYQYSFYPKLDEKIEVTEKDLQNENENYVEAKLAMLCELCQLAPATITFRKKDYNQETGQITESNVSEHLCSSCAKLRVEQEEEEKPEANRKEDKDKIGRNIAHWEFEAEEKKKDIKLCFIKISLNMKELEKALKERFQEEFGIDNIKDEDLGISIIYEFLVDYKEFVNGFRETIFADYQENERIMILPNLFCLKMEKMDDIKRGERIKNIVDQYIVKHKEMFPKLNGKKNPIKFSLAYSNIKFPFTEHWRYLSSKPKSSLNILAVRKAVLEVDFSKYQSLSQMDLSSRRVSHFLHNLTRIEEITDNQLLLEVTIIEKRRDLKEIFQPFTQGEVKAREILAYYKIFGGQ